MIHHGDCLEIMATLPESSVDAIVTDPPYGLGFMGKAWDQQAPARDYWRAMERVAKPGAYLLAFGGTRTVHRMTCAIEDAGWIIRDLLVWAYAQGFPKSKASLKPAWEPIVCARKPGPLRELQIDAARIGAEGGTKAVNFAKKDDGRLERWDGRYRGARNEIQPLEAGRWPANVVLTDPIFDGGWEGVVGGGEANVGKMHSFHRNGGQRAVYGADALAGYQTSETYGDAGTYSRFFLIPKASRVDREPLVPKASSIFGDGLSSATKSANPRLRVNQHPTVKPVALMRHLVRLVTPSGGTVLDPFLGSGTTALACESEGFPWVGIEREAEYVAIAKARLAYVQRGIGLAS